MWKTCCRKLICPQYETKRCLTFYTSCLFFVRFILLNLNFFYATTFYRIQFENHVLFSYKIFLKTYFQILKMFLIGFKVRESRFFLYKFSYKNQNFHKIFSCSVWNSKFEVFSVQLLFYKSRDSEFELIWLIDPVLSMVKSMMGRDFCSQTYSIKKAITLEEEIFARV